MKTVHSIISSFAIFLLAGQNSQANEVKEEIYGTMPDGRKVKIFTLTNKAGRVMEISTNQPAIQFYGGNFLDGKAIGKSGIAYAYRTAFALETENYPDAPNQPSFPSAVLRPGETYKHAMTFKFSVE